ncbi:MAG TPA: PadR family transcriptional regulator [Gemmatimonadaceae bacterium]|jgi:PadR family transcriptional regulator PadR|nr:PadR family transcriptional regulator [Gemmatimonadaceae bacterium]
MILQGTLEMLVLRTLQEAPMHGWGIAQRVQQMSRGVFLVQQGSLYPALVRMKRRGWIKSEWRASENNRRARYYEITPAGLLQLEAERTEWERASTAVNWVLA